MKHIKFFSSSKLGIFLLFLFIFAGVNWFFEKTFLPGAGNDGLWFYSGLFMLYFSILFIEPYYTSPKNVITNVIPVLLLLLPIKTSFGKFECLWWFLVLFGLILLFLSVLAMILENKLKSPEARQNLFAEKIVSIVNFFGKARVIYSLCFLIFLSLFANLSYIHSLIMFVAWFIIVSLNPSKIHSQLFVPEGKPENNQIGTILGVQSRAVFLVKLFEDRKGIKKFDNVRFKYKMAEKEGIVFVGIVFDTYLLNQEKWAKILVLKRDEAAGESLVENVVYLFPNSKDDLNINNFVGIVDSGSDIGKIRFEYSKKEDNLQEGDLLFVKIGNHKIYYQVLNGIVTTESLEARNEMGFIEGEAMQVGEWDTQVCSFKKYGWVPPVNTPVFKASDEAEESKIAYPELQLGVVPGTQLPAVINIQDMISHHIAVLGVTGSGKTFVSRKLIKEALKHNKVICVDFTGEYVQKLKEFSPSSVINDPAGLKKLEKELAEKEIMAKKDNDVKKEILQTKMNISNKLQEYVKTFIEGSNPLGILELPDLSNTSFILEFTQLAIDAVFCYAKEQYQQGKEKKSILIVLEEAHTLVPETTSLGDLGDYGANKALVNKIGQIALQGRKYGVGFMVIAQRTANVSKTVLTQCNTVICFQAFDETSFAFLGNYLGKDLARTLPHLKQYHAVVPGKAMKSSVPMIVDLTEKQPSYANQEGY